MLRVLEDVVEGIDLGCRTGVALCDLSRAFDCVSRDILIQKLSIYGFRGIGLKLLASYLSERTQYVSLDNRRSTILRQVHGVPQGSILGPVLFLLYANDLPDCVTNASTLIFADDTAIYTSHQKIEDVRTNLDVAVQQA